MVSYNEAGVELIPARGKEGRFLFRGQSMRLGAFNEGESWYIEVHKSSGGKVARLSLEEARTLKEAKDMLKYGFFLHVDDNLDLLKRLEELDLLSAPTLEQAGLHRG